MKTTAAIITAIITIFIGVIILFFLLAGMKSFSDKQAAPGMILYLVWFIITSIIVGFFSLLTTEYFIEKKERNPIFSVVFSVIVFVIVGIIFNIVGFFASVFLATALR